MVFGKARETPGVGSVADFAVAAAADLTGKSLLLSAGPLLSSFATAGTGVSKIELHFPVTFTEKSQCPRTSLHFSCKTGTRLGQINCVVALLSLVGLHNG